MNLRMLSILGKEKMHLVKSVQILRMFVMKTQAKPILLCSLCVRRSHVTHLPFNACSSLVGTTSKYKLFSTSAVRRLSLETRTKKKIVLSVPEARRLLSLAKPEKWNLLGAVCLLLVSSSVTMAVPFCLGRVIDIINTADPLKMRENLTTLSVVLLGVFLVGGLCNFGRVYLMSVSGQRIMQTLRQTVFGAIVKQEIAFFDKNKTGELVSRLSADTSLVSQSVTMNISDGLRSTVMVVAGVSMMFYMSPQLALVGLAIVPPVAGMAVIYGRFVRKITKSVQDSLAAAMQVAEERIANIRLLKSFSQESRECDTYNKKLQHVLQLAYKESLARGIFFGLSGFSGNVIVLSVLYYGGVMVSENALTVGNLSAFLLYAGYIGVSIGGLSSFYSEMNRGLGASTRLWELVDRVPTIPVSGGLVPTKEPAGQITFQDVSFTYPSRPDTRVIHNLTLDIPEASITAVVGASGSGKSTLAALLLRLYDPDIGTVLLDGQPVGQLDPRWLRSHIGSVSQEPVLFSCSIRENILYGAMNPSEVTEDQLVAVAKEANAYNFITKNLPDGFDTLVGERGVMLSGGQKQRVAIARALIKNPRILLLDEATSALDAESEHLVQEALERIMQGRTVLIIAHRLSTIRSADIAKLPVVTKITNMFLMFDLAGLAYFGYGECGVFQRQDFCLVSDQIAVLEHGRLVEKGKYSDLLSMENGTFRKLVQHQTFTV